MATIIVEGRSADGTWSMLASGHWSGDELWCPTLPPRARSWIEAQLRAGVLSDCAGSLRFSPLSWDPDDSPPWLRSDAIAPRAATPISLWSDRPWRWWCRWVGCRIRYGQCERCGGLLEQYADGVLPLAIEEQHWLREWLLRGVNRIWHAVVGHRCAHCRRRYWIGIDEVFCSRDCMRADVPF